MTDFAPATTASDQADRQGLEQDDPPKREVRRRLVETSDPVIRRLSVIESDAFMMGRRAIALASAFLLTSQRPRHLLRQGAAVASFEQGRAEELRRSRRS